MKKILLVFLFCSFKLFSQVDYYEDGGPWNNKTTEGPDKDVPGWFYNLGITGIRVQFDSKNTKILLVKYVFPKSPAHAKIKEGDIITGVNGADFKNDHKDGYGMDIFGADGPILEFAGALEEAQSLKAAGRFKISITRNGKKIVEEINVGTKYGTYGANFPANCPKTEKIVKELCAYLVENQQADGSWGSPVENLYAPLALMAANDSKYMRAIKKNVYYQAEITDSKKSEDLINWQYVTAGIVLSEYYLKTKDAKILPELKEIHDFLISTQYMNRSQLHPNQSKTHPDATPKDDKQAVGGWGHNSGFEGYGPIAMITGKAALAFALMKRCGIEVNQTRHEKAYEYLARGTSPIGYTWYGDDVASETDWADMGRTGASAIANYLSPYSDKKYLIQAQLQSKCIGDHPKSFPDTHASPILGMGFTALAANIDAKNLRNLMDNNKFWFVLAQCHDGSFYYQPNRDNAGYDSNSRVSASAVTALIFQMPKKTLHITNIK